MKLRAGIIGCGKIGGLNTYRLNDKLNHASVYSSLRKVELFAVADKNKDNLFKFSKIWKPNKKYLNYKTMIKECKLDIISICTDTSSHYEILKYLLKTNLKKIFVEKPVCESLIQLNYILKNSKDKIISINYFRRWNQEIINLKKNLNSNKFSQIKKINVKYSKSLLNNGLHLIDLCLFLIGNPDKIDKIKKNKYKYDDKNYGYDFNFFYKQKKIDVNFQNIPNINYVFIDFEIFLEEYYIHIKKRSQIIEYFKKTKDENYINLNDLKLIKRENTSWKKCMFKAGEELVNSNSQSEISHSLKDSLKLFKIYDEITK